MTGPALSLQCQRIIALQEQLTDVIDDAECSWAETVGCVGFALTVLIAKHASEAMRVRMAQECASRLLVGAVMRGTFGVTETMQ